MRRMKHNPLAQHARIAAERIRGMIARAVKTNRCPHCGGWLINRSGAMDCADPKCMGLAGPRSKLASLDAAAAAR